MPRDKLPGLALGAELVRQWGGNLATLEAESAAAITLAVTSNGSPDASAHLLSVNPLEHAVAINAGLLSRLYDAVACAGSDPGLAAALRLEANPEGLARLEAEGPWGVFANAQLLTDVVGMVVLHEYSHVHRRHLVHKRCRLNLDGPLAETQEQPNVAEAKFLRFFEVDADAWAAHRAVDWLIHEAPAVGTSDYVRLRMVQILFALGLLLITLDERRTPLERPLAWASPHPIVRLGFVQGVVGGAAWQRFGLDKPLALECAAEAFTLLARFARLCGRAGRPWQRAAAGTTIGSLVRRERRRWEAFSRWLLEDRSVESRLSGGRGDSPIAFV